MANFITGSEWCCYKRSPAFKESIAHLELAKRCFAKNTRLKQRNQWQVWYLLRDNQSHNALRKMPPSHRQVHTLGYMYISVRRFYYILLTVTYGLVDLFYDYSLVSDVLDINDLLDTRSLGMYSACMASHFPALLCSVYRHCSFPRCYTSHCVCPSLNCVFPTALCCAQITSVVSNMQVGHFWSADTAVDIDV